MQTTYNFRLPLKITIYFSTYIVCIGLLHILDYDQKVLEQFLALQALLNLNSLTEDPTSMINLKKLVQSM